MEEYKFKIMFVSENGTDAKTSLISKIYTNRFNPYIESSAYTQEKQIYIQTDLGILL